MEDFRLEPTPEDEARREAEKEARQVAYRRRYWQQYKQEHRRVYGTVTPEEYEAVRALALASGRSVWEQIWSESCAYRAQTYLPPEAILTEIRRLYAELRRIGNNLNQIAHHSNIFQRVAAPKQVGVQLDALEQAIARFVSKPWTPR